MFKLHLQSSQFSVHQRRLHEVQSLMFYSTSCLSFIKGHKPHQPVMNGEKQAMRNSISKPSEGYFAQTNKRHPLIPQLSSNVPRTLTARGGNRRACTFSSKHECPALIYHIQWPPTTLVHHLCCLSVPEGQSVTKLMTVKKDTTLLSSFYHCSP